MFSTTNCTQSNIAAIDAKDSESVLFSQSQEPLTPVVHVRDLQNWRPPVFAHDKNRNVDQQENTTVVIQQRVYAQFEQDIICSELLSRGWTYQEILLSPANLLCTRQMMWWSCSDASCSELFPENIPTLGDDREEPPHFVDALRSRKVSLKSGKDPINTWLEVISSYSRTSVTFRDDRIVAIAGIARLFSSWFPELLDSADPFGHFHSGIWSTNVIRQLLWKCDSLQRSRRSQHYPNFIPSWSPLSSLCCYPTHNLSSTTIALAEYVEIGSSGTTGVFRTDRFGRVQNENEAVLHLRSVLFPIIVEEQCTGVTFREEEQEEQEKLTQITSVVRLKDYSGKGFSMIWDTVEYAQRALSPSNVNGVDLRALPCEVYQWDGLPEQFHIVGIVLRPDYDAFHPSSNNEEIKRNLWVRCGYFECHVTPQFARGYERAFALERYGWTVETGFADYRGKKEQAHVHLARTGTAPDLEDVFII